MYNFAGKYAVVTGAGQGIGKVIAKRLLDDGMEGVALLDYNEPLVAATAAELDPTGKAIALGGDLDGVTYMSEGFEGVQDYPKMAAQLHKRGLEEGMIRDIFWNNGLGVMERAVCNHKK